MVEEVVRYITESRLRGVISKEGIPKPNDLGKFTAFFAKVLGQNALTVVKLTLSMLCRTY